MQKLIFTFLLAWGFFLSVSASAVPALVKQDGIYYGATRIEVNNVSYDVQFLDGIFGDVFAANPWTPFSSEADVWTANSLLHSLIVAETDLNLDPSLTSGCSIVDCYILSPIASRADDGSYIFGENNPFHSYVRSAASINALGTAPGSDFEAVSDTYLFIDTHDWLGLVWAKWSLSEEDVSVPESSGLIMVFMGILLLLGRRFLIN